MKRRLILLASLLLPLCSCSSLWGKKKASSLEPLSEPPSSSVEAIDTYDFTYDGPDFVLMNYGTTHQLGNFLFDGEKKDLPLLFYVSQCSDKDALTIGRDGLLTARNYDKASQNKNELFKIRVSSIHAKQGQVADITIAIVDLHENVSFSEFLDGTNYSFYTSIGIVENLVSYEIENREWYSECTLHEEVSGESFTTTITKNLHSIGYESSIVTSHFKTVINRDERGSLTAKEIKNGSKIKFLTMFSMNEEFGYPFGFNTIMLEEISRDNEEIEIDCLDKSIEIDKLKGHFDDTFTIQIKNDGKHISVRGDYGPIYPLNINDENRVEEIYPFASKHIKVYSSNNDPGTYTLYEQYPAGNSTELSTDLQGFLFGDDSPIKVRRSRLANPSPSGMVLGRESDTTCPYLDVAIPRELGISRIEMDLEILSKSKPSIFYFTSNADVSSGTGWREIEIPTSTPNVSYTFSKGSLPFREFTIFSNPREKIGNKYAGGVILKSMRFYTKDALIRID